MENTLIHKLQRRILRIAGHGYEKGIPPRLWHYTNVTGALGIIQSKELWLTNAAYLNDSTEQWLGRALFVDAATKLREITKNPVHADALDMASQQFYSEANAGDALSNVYLTCLSTREDSLTQWRAYGHGEGGYAIGFDTRELIDEKRNNERVSDLWLLPCLYEKAQHKELIDQMLTAALARFEKLSYDAQQGAAELISTASWLSACIKNERYADEGEWRLALFSNAVDENHYKFNAGALLRPYWPCKFDLRAIKQVVVGPQRHKELAAASVRLLCKQNDADHANVILSNVPYRPVY